MQLEESRIVRRVREREAPAPLARQHHVHVLARLPGERLDRGQPQPESHDVRRQPGHALDPRRQLADLDIRDVADLAGFDDQVLLRAGLADECVAGRGLAGIDAGGTAVRVFDGAAQDADPAGAAGSALAAVREVEVLAERGGEHGLVGMRLELAAGRQDADLHPPIIAAPKERPRTFRCGARSSAPKWLTARPQVIVVSVYSPPSRAALRASTSAKRK